MVLTCCFIALSQLPLVVTLYLVLWLINHDYQYGLLAPCLLGEVTFYQDGRVQQGERVMYCKRTLSILSELVLLLKLDQHWYLLWRDSANDQAYWQLMLQLKKEP
ncbi:hypothetical protein H2O73_15985 [Vibrio sp. 404]|uniref:Cell shape-determining protein n=1 Tax=Vibrio marinisediminis TaxID=2758441 RepID=A0A7W2FTA5_9VIBR|nr:hypothetical protein [Vibrio marinisediminis]